MSPKSVKDLHALLSSALRSAQQRGDVRLNVAKGLRLPAVQREQKALLEREAFAAILAEVAERWRPFFLLLAQTGMRWGEAAALMLSDVDVKRSTVRISKAGKRIDGAQNVVGPTKTPRSRRTISAPASPLVELAPLLKTRGRIFAHLIGEGLRSDCSREAWERGVKRARAVNETATPKGWPKKMTLHLRSTRPLIRLSPTC